MSDTQDESMKTNKIRKLLNKGVLPAIVKVIENVTHEEALIIEDQLIRTLGTRHAIDGIVDGPLTNFRAGDPTTRISASPSDETRQKMSESRKMAWQDPESREGLLKQAREQCETLTKKYHEDEEYQERWLSIIRQAANTPESKKKKSNNALKQWTDEESKETILTAIRDGNVERWKDPVYRATMIQSNKDRWKDPVWAAETTRKMKETKARKKMELIQGSAAEFE
jgi:hypothetical protein